VGSVRFFETLLSCNFFFNNYANLKKKSKKTPGRTECPDPELYQGLEVPYFFFVLRGYSE
jgi:hypothetical protein